MDKKKLQVMTTGQKAKYLFGKYVWHVTLAVFLISAIGTRVYVDCFKEQPVLEVDMINVNQQSADGESFLPFLLDAGYTPEECNVKIDKRMQFGCQKGDLHSMPHQLLIAKEMVGSTDLYFWNTANVEQALADVCLMDLRQVMSPEYLEENAENIIYTGPLLDGGYPCAIKLLDNQWVLENNYYEDCAVGVSRHAEDRDLVSRFLTYISLQNS